MENSIERKVSLPGCTVHLATLSWDGVEKTPAYSGYSLSQRLSDDHSALRIGNASAPSVLPRLHSVGLLPPGRAINLFPVERPLRVLYCVFEEGCFEGATGVQRETWDRHIGALVAMNNRRLEVLMQGIHAELEAPGFGSELLMKAVADMLLVELARHVRKLDDSASSKAALAPWQMRRIEERVALGPEAGYPDTAELAELCCISQGHLMRSFKATSGWQVHKFIADERIKAARKMLTDGDASCKEIANKLGFGSSAYFATAFKKAVGATPMDFRRRAREAQTAQQ